MRWRLTSSYLDLPSLFYTEQPATPVKSPSLVVFNSDLAETLGLGAWEPGDEQVLAGNGVPPGLRPFAQAYAGHQYGHLTMLGDGRALVLGEANTPDGLYDLQLKGSGPTPYSRRGDGRAALGPMLREYLMGEAFHALGIPTTRALAVVRTGESVWREGPRPGAVLTRVARSHLRVGTFEYACGTGELEALRTLVDYALNRHFPQAAQAPRPGLALLTAVAAAQAKLIAQWMAVGFVHGVMNTDNMALSGETIDFGPCAFLDGHSRHAVFSSIDQQGRYSFGNQPGIARWNLTRFAEALLPVLHENEGEAIALAQTVIDGFAALYETHHRTCMAAKLALPPDLDDAAAGGLIEGLLDRMEASGADHTLTFRSLLPARDGVPLALPDGETWRQEWVARVGDPDAARTRLAQANPVYIPRNQHLQNALDAAEAGDLGPFHTLLSLVKDPYRPRPGFESYERAIPSESPFVTYCGT